MAPAGTGRGARLWRRSSAELRACMRNATSLRLSSTSTTSSCTPSMLVYSCSTPSISTSVIAAPGMLESSTRRKALPSVWPKPRSNGSMTTRACRGATGCTLTTRGLRNSLTEDCISASPLLRIQLDDQILVDVREHILASRYRLEYAAHFLVVDLDPFRQACLGRRGQRTLDAQLLAGALPHLHDITRAALVGGDRDDAAVDLHGLVAHELARLGARRGKAHAVHDVVEPRFQELQQLLARGAGAARRLLVVATELALEHAVHAAELLLLAQLQAVIGQPLPPLALDAAGRHLELALALERLGAALEKQVGALPAGKVGCTTGISRHLNFLQSRSDAARLWRTAAVVRNRRGILH